MRGEPLHGHAQPTVVETPLMGKEYKDWCIYCYVCVSARLGAFLLVKCTGTKGTGSGEPPNETWKVSRGHTCLHHWLVGV